MKFNKEVSFPLISSILFTITPLVSTSFLTIYVLQYQDFLNTLGWADWFYISLVFTVTSALALSPPTFLAVIHGYFLGFEALPYQFMINMGAIILVNLVVRKIDNNRFIEILSKNPKVAGILNGIKKEELKIIFFSKLSPVLPFALTNFVFAISGARLRNVLLGGFMGMIPRTVLAVWTGSQAKEIQTLIEHPNQGLFQQVFILILLIASVVGLSMVFRKVLKPAE
ncbi:hypothetical protein GVN16_15225 [Emticicia sp. CRIBPO]|uniref:TVP38/TMEM64 family protein n=1 Tax=Emticicia sp. CRIBPO TaxID=2683258 RepID=UPI0014130817|nr:VTT domain-containing protein [Emticicia sp. CRIBPO]NBA87122.1 hypothetical protein [Emticicia sp. CRIBPO]